MVSFISSLKITDAVKPDPTIFSWIAAVVNPNGIKMLLANGLSEFPIKGNPVFNNGSISLPKNPPDCSVLSN